LALVLPALASDRDDDLGRIQKATQVFQQIMRTPDKGIPRDLLEKRGALPSFQERRRQPSYSAATTARDWLPAVLPRAGARQCLWPSEAEASASRLEPLSPTW
jgi:hypothetical protein